MVDLAREIGSEIWGGCIGLTTFIILTVGGDPTAFDLAYYVTKVVDLAFSGAAALISFLLVHIAKRQLSSGTDNWLKRTVKVITDFLNKK